MDLRSPAFCLRRPPATGISALLCLPIVIAALFDGEKEITRLDWMSLAAALLAGVAWAVNHDPTMSVVQVVALIEDEALVEIEATAVVPN